LSGGPPLTRFAWLSILGAVLTMALKTEAYVITGSVGLLSDAAESLVNLAAAVVALAMLTLAARPADPGHPFGHGKAEYFASGFEGALILVAAGGIAWAAWDRLWHPQPLAELNLGMAISAAAAAVNGGVAWVLLRAGRKYGSITLEADGRHLMSDVWTTGAVLLALGGIAITGWQWLDPIIAFLAALQIVWSGVSLMRRSVSGLLDAAIPPEEKAQVDRILDRYRAQGIQFHDLRTRAAGMQRLITVHVLVPGQLTVQEGHDFLERIEGEIQDALGNVTIVTHLEPLEDAASFAHDRLELDPAADAASVTRAGVSGAKTGSREATQQWRASRRGRRRMGAALLLLGGAATLVLPDFYAGIGLGIGLLGVALGFSGRRTRPA
jgi:Ca2+-transporting ATPase